MTISIKATARMLNGAGKYGKPFTFPIDYRGEMPDLKHGGTLISTCEFQGKVPYAIADRINLSYLSGFAPPEVSIVLEKRDHIGMIVEKYTASSVSVIVEDASTGECSFLLPELLKVILPSKALNP